MASLAHRLQKLVPDIDPSLVQGHVIRLDRRYFQRFSDEKIAAHLTGLSRLSAENPVDNTVEKTENGMVECTILAYDYPSEFSLISGVLSSMGFDTLFGDVFTYSAAASAPASARGGSRRFIIDCFTGKVSPERWSERWAEELSERLGAVILLLEQGGKESLYKTKLTVNEMAAKALAKIGPAASTVLYPVQIEVDASPPSCTRMRVVSQDTPFFLFAFSTALSLQGVSIEHVTIRTEGGRIEDVFEFVDVSGAKIEDPGRIDRIKLSVLLTKQFTSFLEGAPDPLAALLRFESLVRDILPLPQKGMWYELLSNQNVLSDLAQLLGASTFLWEDFIRLQYETLIPMLRPHVQGKSFAEPLELLPERIELALAGAETDAEFERRLNEFKDKEIFLFDLDHILTPGSDFLELSRRLTTLAELVVEYAASRAFRSLIDRFGTPMSIGGIPAAYAIMGLGKMGGAALGYASDIELLFVYSDSGSTSGPETLDNSEFFDRLVRETQRLVHAKREGIFHVDLRLRPHGAAGPMACSLESFCTYYAKGGPAQAYERLSLVRLRAVGGDRRLGGRIERLRDEMIYSADAIDLAELRVLRERQMREKTRPGQLRGSPAERNGAVSAGSLNAKFSPGALVDLEYAVQVLQVTHGAEEKRLRTSKVHEALSALASAGILEKAEADELIAAYHFFRRLINGLRMLRGSAQDLFLPPMDSVEYRHLARRTGYEPDPDMTPAQKLHLDFETHTAEVRAFVEKRFGRDSLPGRSPANVADIILSDSIPDAQAKAILAAKGFQNPARALVNLRNLSGGERGRRGAPGRPAAPEGRRPESPPLERRSLFARLAILACDILAQRPDPDMALNNWERYLQALPDPQEHFSRMLSQPMRLEILLSIFSASNFLADTLIRDPALLDYIGRPEILHARNSPETVAAELHELSVEADRAAWLAALRRYRGREILRIGARDVCLGTPTATIMDELSCLADGIVEAALERIRMDAVARRPSGGALRRPSGGSGESGPRFCVLAFGKLGGRELNYSSDIDLLGLCDASDESGTAIREASAYMEALRSDLSSRTPEGYVYRVDLRLRPYGSSGQLVSTASSLLDYYSRSAALWELQALLKARPIAGDQDIGRAFLDKVKGVLLSPRDKSAVASAIDNLREKALKGLPHGLPGTTDVKAGLGGLRDVEFLVQGIQLIHAKERPGLLEGNTVAALEAIAAAGILPRETTEQLAGDYLFLRRVEHFLQIYEDRQTHSLPRDPGQMLALARRMLGSGATVEQFRAKLAKRFERVRESYRRFAQGGP